MNKENAVIYCRVSTGKQAEHGFSIEGQQKICEKYCKDKGINVNKIFLEKGASAKSIKREEFLKMLKYIKEKRNNVDAIVVYKLDRLTRSNGDFVFINNELKKLKIKLICATMDNNSETSEGTLINNILVSIAQFSNDLNSDRTKMGMKTAVEDGRYLWPILGYSFPKDMSKDRILVPDENAKYIKMAFELAEKNLYTQIEIVKKLKEAGCNKMNKSRLSRILKSPVYAGFYKYKYTESNDFINGKHEPIITKELFYKVQGILSKRRYSTQTYKKNKNNKDFPLRNLIVCKRCNSTITGGWSTSHNKQKHAYYRCQSKKCIGSIKKGVMEEKFLSLIKRISLRLDEIELTKEYIETFWDKNIKDNEYDKRTVKKQLTILEGKQGKLLDLYCNEKISEGNFEQKNNEILKNIKNLKKKLHNNQKKIGSLDGFIDFIIDFIRNLADFWDKGSIYFKKKFQNFVFPEGLTYDGEKLETKKINVIFSLFEENIARNKKWLPR